MLIVLLACFYLCFQILRGNKPSVLGYRFYYILTDSMTPELQVNDVILSKVINDVDQAKQVKEGDVITFIVDEGVLKGMTITHKVITEPYFDEVRNQTVVITMGTKQGATPDAPVPLESIQAVMVRKLGFFAKMYNFVTSHYGMLILIIAPMSVIVAILAIRLTRTVKNQPMEGEKQLTPEEIAKKAVEEFKQKERLEKEIAQKAVEEYIKQEQNKENK